MDGTDEARKIDWVVVTMNRPLTLRMDHLIAESAVVGLQLVAGAQEGKRGYSVVHQGGVVLPRMGPVGDPVVEVERTLAGH